jgi:hypothetical protein
MGRCRTVRPETVRIDISDGDWIEVKQALTYGEAAKARAVVVKEVRTDGRMTPDFELVEIAQVLAYLVNWSLVDDRGKRIVIDTDAKLLAGIHAQDSDTIREIIDAVSAHVERREAERAAEKNAKDGATASSTISPSAA